MVELACVLLDSNDAVTEVRALLSSFLTVFDSLRYSSLFWAASYCSDALLEILWDISITYGYH